MEENFNLYRPEPTLDEWKKLYEATIEFKKLKPWRWMRDNDLFAVKNPETGEYAYCCVMGNMDEYYGITAYLGAEGLSGAFKLINDEISPDDPDSMFMLNCLMLSLEDRQFLTEEDRNVIKQLGLRFRGKNEWPLFRSHKPGYFPWYISSDECRFFTVIINQCIYVAMKCKEEGSDFLRYSRGVDDPRAIAFFTRVPERKNGGVKWNDEYITPPEYTPRYSSFEIKDELKVRRLKKIGKQKGSAWEIDTFYSPGPVQERPGLRPYYPKVCLVFEQGRGRILGFNIIKSIDTEGIKFIDMINEIIEKYKQFPFKIMVQRDETYFLLQSYCKQLGINLEKVDRLLNLDEARYQMHNFFEYVSDTGSDFDD